VTWILEIYEQMFAGTDTVGALLCTPEYFKKWREIREEIKK
jgi:hypothetical protein